MLSVVGTGVRDVLQHILAVETIPLCNRHEALGPKRTLSIDVERLALSTTTVNRQLARDAQRMTELRLSTSKLAKYLRDLPGLHAASQERVELRRAGGELNHVLTHLEHLSRTDHAQRNERLRCIHDPVGLLLADALDVSQLPHRHESDGLYAMDPMLQQELDVSLREAGAMVFSWSAKSLELGDPRIVYGRLIVVQSLCRLLRLLGLTRRCCGRGLLGCLLLLLPRALRLPCLLLHCFWARPQSTHAYPCAGAVRGLGVQAIA
mmetsp:Transcript_9833/g.17543  ORF Transcript_9833/g.17543 Transcript_9833/m.17543 type:complete len:264 (+) Transcript_9833:537-1328(+)